MSIAHSIFLVLKGFLCFVDPTSSREIEREEPSLTIVTQTRTVKQEEKIEKMPMKRQRRQKTTSDSISKEEEKKVLKRLYGLEAINIYHYSELKKQN